MAQNRCRQDHHDRTASSIHPGSSTYKRIGEVNEGTADRWTDGPGAGAGITIPPPPPTCSRDHKHQHIDTAGPRRFNDRGLSGEESALTRGGRRFYCAVRESSRNRKPYGGGDRKYRRGRVSRSQHDGFAAAADFLWGGAWRGNPREDQGHAVAAFNWPDRQEEK